MGSWARAISTVDESLSAADEFSRKPGQPHADTRRLSVSTYYDRRRSRDLLRELKSPLEVFLCEQSYSRTLLSLLKPLALPVPSFELLPLHSFFVKACNWPPLIAQGRRMGKDSFIRTWTCYPTGSGGEGIAFQASFQLWHFWGESRKFWVFIGGSCRTFNSQEGLDQLWDSGRLKWP